VSETLAISGVVRNLRAPARQLPSPEYTDLDVFVSRLEGSGREYAATLIEYLQ
jgi:hypothetical protein